MILTATTPDILEPAGDLHLVIEEALAHIPKEPDWKARSVEYRELIHTLRNDGMAVFYELVDAKEEIGRLQKRVDELEAEKGNSG